MQRVCVFCGSKAGSHSGYAGAGATVGRLIAESGQALVYGGGRVGMMGVVADAALAAGGEVIGVIPHPLATRELAHDGVTEMHRVDSMHERKALMADLSDGFVALPGGFGTLDEFFEIITWAQLGIHHCPCGLLNVDGYFDPLLHFLDHAVTEGFISEQFRALILVDEDPARLLERMGNYEPPASEVRWVTPEQR